MASGDSLCKWHPSNNEPPVNNYATLDTRNSRPCLDFDAAANEDAVFSDVMPRHYAGTTGVTVYIHYAMSTAEALTIDWDAAFERGGDQDFNVDGDGFAAVNSVDDTTVPGTSGLVDIVSIAFTDGADMDSVTAGDGFRLKITRDAVSDDAVGDSEMFWLELRET